MTRKELNLAIFEGKANRVLWQPRLETWINHHASHGTLPPRFRDMNNLQIYDALRCSIRYGASAGIDRFEKRDDLVRISEQHPSHSVERVRTPVGELTTVYRDIWDGNRRVNHRIEDFPVKTAQDLRVATDLINRQQFQANPEAFEKAAKNVGHRGEPTIFLTSSGFTDLIKWWCGLVGTYYLLNDHPTEVEAFLEACDRRDERMITEALKLPCRLFNLGDHATNEFTPPPILKKYLMPRWQRIAGRLHAAGRFVHTHWDGHSKLMLPYLRDTRLDGAEALTPAPMGDMTLDEIKKAVGHGLDQMVVLDLLPAIDFLPNHSTKDLLDFARRVIDMFAPRLILGISDEISQPGQIEKVEAVTELVDKVCALAD
ncbi:MAG: hypothetical protein FJ279_27620 [Planctomycetes bacterium]|nr:hypothetical protein [Planctomycetota bacterium]MBM4079256.1 hypothetical protein [Planctomycetota bacterium]